MGEKSRVLVFGGTGVGKTSLCNVLSGRSRPTNSGAIGVTAKSHVYGVFEHAGQRIELVDTVGLHEADTGTVPTDQAVAQLVELLKNAKEGFNLLVHVSKMGRLTREHQEDYDFFVNKLTQHRIPVVLILTGCENEHPMSSWVDKNVEHFRQFDYRTLIATCFAEGGPLESHFSVLRAESREAVLRSIVNVALPLPAKLYGEGTGTTVAELLARLWNDIVEITGLPANYRTKANESVYEFMRRIGVSEKIADAAIKHLPDLIAEGASKLPVPLSGPTAKMLSRKLLQKLFRRPTD
jgi:tRNA U34 5-carboxymethylaminomethyl modifying GTPase MnmE/TrmE